MHIAIIKYGMGNVTSVEKALKKLGYACSITDVPNEIKAADLILLPGVGSFKKGMENLRQSGLVKLLTEEVVENKKPFIGICLGMQLIASHGTEPEPVNGLGWIEGEVIKMELPSNMRVPHLGWNAVHVKTNHPFYQELEGEDYYFIHSYHFNVTNREYITLSVNYGKEMVAAIQKDNIYAMQFHPEKSQTAGMYLLKKIIETYA